MWLYSLGSVHNTLAYICLAYICQEKLSVFVLILNVSIGLHSPESVLLASVGLVFIKCSEGNVYRYYGSLLTT